MSEGRDIQTIYARLRERISLLDDPPGTVLSENRLARWRRIVVEACKQSGRRRIPEIEDPVAIADARPSGTGMPATRSAWSSSPSCCVIN